MKICSTFAAAIVAFEAVATTVQAEHVQRSLILGGEVVPDYSKSYVVGLRTTAHGETFCTGTLIAPNYVLTTSWCGGLEPNFAAVGTRYINGTDDGERIPIELIVLHPMRFDEVDRQDFALLKLSTPAEYPCVELDTNGSYFEYGNTAKAMGWGDTAYPGVRSYELLMIDLPMWNDTACSVEYTLVRAEGCAGGEENRDMCVGDTGGPLVIENEGYPDTLVGMSTRGQGCGNAGIPGVFVRVNVIIDWIYETMATYQ